MRNTFAFLVGLLLALLAGAALAAAPQCTYYRVTTSAITGSSINSGYQIDRAAACAALVGKGSDAGYRVVTSSWDGSTGSPDCVGTRRWVPSGTVEAFDTGASDSWATQLQDCPVDPCDAYAGKKVTYAQSFGSVPAVGSNFNIPVAGGCGADLTAASSCTPSTGGGWFCMVTYSYTGDVPAPSPTAPAGAAAECAVIKGKQNCAIQTDDGTGQTCGTFNGERMCFPVDPTTDPAGQPPPGSCWSTNGGGLLCADDVAVEDDTGTPVDPTQTLVTDHSTSNYYDETTIATSNVTTIVTGTGPMGGEGDPVDADCEGVDCLTGGDLSAVDDPGTVASSVMGRIQGAPLVAAVGALSGSLEGGTCPVWSTTVNAAAFGTYNLDFGFICTLWEDIAPILAAVMLAGWVLLAVRILMSA